MSGKKGPFGRKLRKHLRALLIEHGESGLVGRPTDEALLAELRYKHASDYSNHGLKEKALLRELSAARSEIDQEGKYSGNVTPSGGFRHAHPSSARSEGSNVGETSGDEVPSDKSPEEKSATDQLVAGNGAQPRPQKRPMSVQVCGGGDLNSALRTSYQQQNTTPAAEVQPDAPPNGTASVGSPLPEASRGPGAPERIKRRRVRRSEPLLERGDGPGPIGMSSAIEFLSDRPATRYSDLGGMESVVPTVRQLVELPLRHPELYSHLGVDPPLGLLLHGASGSGKSMLVDAVAGELGLPFIRVSGPEVVGANSGDSESKLRDLFAAATELARASGGCLLFLDEIDAITPKRTESSRGMEKRMVAQLLTCMDSLRGHAAAGGPTPPPDQPAADQSTVVDQPSAAADQSSAADPVPWHRAPVVVIGATCRPDSVDGALRRAGRFDREVGIPVPDQRARESILRVVAQPMRLSGDVDFKAISRRTPGYVGADLMALAKEAAMIAIERLEKAREKSAAPLLPPVTLLGATEPPTPTGSAVPQNNSQESSQKKNSQDKVGGDKPMDHEPAVSSAAATPATAVPSATAGIGPNPPVKGGVKGWQLAAPLHVSELGALLVTSEDFIQATKIVQPTAKREGFATAPGVSWADIGALSAVREELSLSVLEPINYPERFEALGLPLPAGILLYGPPGCGKTLLAKAVANESGTNFISVKGPELLDKFVGESEKAVRRVFERARSSAPCVVFFDELDSLAPRRGTGGGEGSGNVSERVVNQLLTELDGLESRRSVFVIAATNRPELIDPAMLRPGRLDKRLYVPLPCAEERASILLACARRPKLTPGLDLSMVAHDPRCEGFSGADMAALVREAGLAVLRSLPRPAALAAALGRTAAEAAEALSKEAGSAAAGEAGELLPKLLAIGPEHFEAALSRVKPSVTAKDRARYLAMRVEMDGDEARSVFKK